MVGGTGRSTSHLLMSSPNLLKTQILCVCSLLSGGGGGGCSLTLLSFVTDCHTCMCSFGGKSGLGRVG